MALKFLVVEDDEDIREIITMHLEEEFGAQVSTATCANEAIDKLKLGLQVNCIVSDYRMPNGNGGELFLYLKQNGIKTPFILCSGNDPSTLPEFVNIAPDFYVSKPNILGPLTEIINNIPFPNVTVEIDLQEYFPIRSKSLLRVGQLPSAVFLKLAQEKYVKILDRGDFFNADDYHKYSLKKIDVFYILGTEREAFFGQWLKDLDQLEKFKDLPPTEFDVLAAKSIENIHLLISELGAHPDVQKKISQTAELAIRSICADPSLLGLMQRILVDPEHYLTQHSLSVGHIACALANLMGWKSDATLMKLQVAALLHDVTLTTHELDRVRELDQVDGDVATMNAAEKSFFTSHPLQAALLIQDFKQLPPDVDQIIRHHHELPDGSGYPEKLNHQKISPISSVFIMAHHFYAFSSTRTGADPKTLISDFLKFLPASFQLGHFKKIMSKLNQVSLGTLI